MSDVTDANAADRNDAALWHSHMLSGEFEQAWQASDRIRARGCGDPHRFWTGEPVAGKDVIVRSLHGLGDAVQMFQYAPKLKSLARSVTWQVPPNLVELARCFKGVEHVITWDEPREWELQVEITELPYIFRTTLQDLPVSTRYLKLPAQPAFHSGKPRVGFVWAAGEWKQSRSLPLAALATLFNKLNCELISLQGGASPDTDPRLSTIGPGLPSLAAAIAGLHLVITVDTLAAHLAGALGIPAFVLLEHDADWRWMSERVDSPWYPSLRLFRQPAASDWTTPLRAVGDALGTLSL
jgi:hypothetical protein